jgi:hypothetical protein
MSICGADGGIAPIAPGPLSSIKDTIKYDLSVIIIETAEVKTIYRERPSLIKKEQVPARRHKELPASLKITTFIDPVTREQTIEII